MNMGAYLHVQPRLQRCMEVRWVADLWIDWVPECAGFEYETITPAHVRCRLVAHSSSPACSCAGAGGAQHVASPTTLPQATDREVGLRIKYSGRPTMASTATGFGEVHAQEQVNSKSTLPCMVLTFSHVP